MIKHFLLLKFFIFISASLIAQSYTVSGKVIDENNDPVPFAQVAIYPAGGDSPTKGTVSGDNGAFNLQVKQGKYNIEISFV
ncbi:MAG: carboxypeptidase-like regulatory domain-containing protein, partial [Cyclobacteriaceae bacterium]